MLHNYFKLAIRHFLFNKQSTILNLLGLSIGIAGFLLLLQYTLFEKSYDRYHEKTGDIHRVTMDVYRNNKLNVKSATSYFALPPALKNDFPEVENYTRFFGSGGLIHIGEKRFREEAFYYTDSTLFEVFSINMLHGDSKTALINPNSAVLSETAALKYFNSLDCVGSRFEIQNWPSQQEYVVTGVMADIPENSHFRSEMFLSMTTLSQIPDLLSEWGWRDFYNYLVIKPGSAELLEQKMNATDYIADHYERFRELNIHQDLHLQPIEDIHLNSNLSLEAAVNGNGKAVNLLLLIGLFILLMAWVNYINLTTAKAVTRAKEVGVRKTIGANRGNLMKQFLTQSLLLNALAFLIALILLETIQPFFHALIGKNISFQWVQDPMLLGGLSIVFLGGLLLSSFYPAFVLSGFSPKTIFNQEKIGNKVSGALLRKSLIVLQFGIAILFVAGTLVVLQQLQFMRKKDLGMDISQTLVVRAPNLRDSLTVSEFELFKQRLLQNSSINSIASSHNVPGDENTWVPGIRKITEDASNAVSQVIFLNSIDPSFVAQYELEVLAGRNFYPNESASAHSMLLTETACRTFGIQNYEEALGQRYRCMGDTFTVRGVVSDYQQWGFQKAPGEYVFINSPEEFRRIAMKISTEDLAGTIDFVNKAYDEVFPTELFEYFFLDSHFEKQYQADAQFGKITSIFAGLAIFIACLGLLGLSLFIVLQRRKEIGIRKVLGATTAGLVGLLSMDFLKLVFLSIFIATPIAWYFMNEWLQDFAYRIDIQWTIFVFAGIIAIGIAFLTVSFQSVKAALANPIESLRSE